MLHLAAGGRSPSVSPDPLRQGQGRAPTALGRWNPQEPSGVPRALRSAVAGAGAGAGAGER